MGLRPTTTCVVCAKPFYASPGHLAQGWGKYCGKACNSIAQQGNRNARWKDVGDATCSHCGKEFHRKPSHHGKRTFCSDPCRKAAYPKRLQLKCERCGKGFDRPPSHYTGRAIRFCSFECARIASRNRVTITCIRCGKQVARKPSHFVKRGAGSYCSMACKAASMSASQLTTSGVNRNSSRRGGKRDDLQGRYFRSSWEANWARYLNWLRDRGEIARWEFEPDTFEFPVKRGSKFYTPDFKVFYPDGTVLYHEVKGWMDQVSATKLRRMAKHYPQHTVRLIDAQVYRATARTMAPIIEGWERASDGSAS